LGFITLIITGRLFIIAAVLGTGAISLLYGNSSAVEELKTTPTGLNS
jgi:hypothetical protein